MHNHIPSSQWPLNYNYIRNTTFLSLLIILIGLSDVLQFLEFIHGRREEMLQYLTEQI